MQQYFWANIYSEMYMLTSATPQENFQSWRLRQEYTQLHERMFTVCVANSEQCQGNNKNRKSFLPQFFLYPEIFLVLLFLKFHAS